MSTKRSINQLFTDLEVVDSKFLPPEDGENHLGRFLIQLESRTCEDTLAINVLIPVEAASRYKFGQHGPLLTIEQIEQHQIIGNAYH